MSTLAACDFAKWVYDNVDSSVYEEDGKYHISTSFFMENRIMELASMTLLRHIDQMKIASVVGISQGWDHGIHFITTWLALKCEKPFYVHTERELRAPNIAINSNLSNCSLLVAYTSYEEQVADLLSIAERLGGNVVQIISLVDERGVAERACIAKRVEFHKLFSTADIINSLQRLPNTNLVTVNRITNFLTM